MIPMRWMKCTSSCPLKLFVFCFACGFSACGGKNADNDTDGKPSNDASSDADTNIDTTTGSDTTGTDGDSDSDGDADGDSDTDTDADADTDTDTDGDADTGGSDSGTDGGDTDTVAPPDGGLISWILHEEGTFQQGNSNTDSEYYNETPDHQVSVKGFYIARTETTVAQFRACVTAGACSEPFNEDDHCNYFATDREKHPVNCVSLAHAESFCAWTGGRLPSESEWEYAARGGGSDVEFPWGGEPAGCERAVSWDGNRSVLPGCGSEMTWPVCSRSLGNTPRGLCDMAGNVEEWVPDWYHGNYEDAPGDGGVWVDQGVAISRVVRGGSYLFAAAGTGLRTRARHYSNETARPDTIGFRCAW